MGTKRRTPPGVTIRDYSSGKKTINISFTYQGIRCREPLTNLAVTTGNIRYAGDLLGEIRNKIERKVFVYADHFPNSTKLEIFGAAKSGADVLYYLNLYIDNAQTRNCSVTTITGYNKCKNRLKPLHDIPVTELTPATIKTYIQNSTVKIKTMNNTLSLLRPAVNEALIDGLITVNPLAGISASQYMEVAGKVDIDGDNEDVDPFSPNEVEQILRHCEHDQDHNLLLFAFKTGLRSGELCGLRWQDINTENRQIHIRQNVVENIIKGPKTKSGRRTVEIDNDVVAILINQAHYTKNQKEFVFHNPRTKEPWSGASVIRTGAWIPALRKAGVRYRYPYQTRHTYATMHISNGANHFWLAGQLGHSSPDMLYRHYGSYIEAYDKSKQTSREHDPLSSEILIKRLENETR